MKYAVIDPNGLMIETGSSKAELESLYPKSWGYRIIRIK